MEAEMTTEGLTAAAGGLPHTGSSLVLVDKVWNVWVEKYKHHTQQKCTVHTDTPILLHSHTLPSNVATKLIQKSHWQTGSEKKTRSQVKEEVSDSRQRKGRGKQYGNGHIGLITSCFLCISTEPQTSKKAVDCNNESPTDLHKQHTAFKKIWGAYWPATAYLSDCLGSLGIWASFYMSRVWSCNMQITFTHPPSGQIISGVVGAGEHFQHVGYFSVCVCEVVQEQIDLVIFFLRTAQYFEAISAGIRNYKQCLLIAS